MACSYFRVLEIVVDSVFHMKGRGTVLAGRVASGQVAIGDAVEVRSPAAKVRSTVTGLEVQREFVAQVSMGSPVAVLLKDFVPERVRDGLQQDESGGWRVIDLRIHGVARPWWRFW